MTDTRDEGRRGVVADIIAEGLDAEAERCDAARRDSGLLEYRSAGPGLNDAATRLLELRAPLRPEGHLTSMMASLPGFEMRAHDSEEDDDG